MSADKKIDPADLPRPDKKEERLKGQEEFDDKAKERKQDLEKAKKSRVNYIIKDLPIY